MARVTTLSEFIIERQKDFPFASGELSRLLSAISLAAKIVNREVNKAGLAEDILGAIGTENIQGEEQMKLDVYANNQFIEALQSQGIVCGVASEEDEDFIPFKTHSVEENQYVVLMDPLDGSSNIDVNVSIGTIFSIYRKVSTGEDSVLEDYLQKGTDHIASGYVLYGSSTMLVYSTGNGVNGFTYDPSIGSFCLSHPDMKTPADGKIYSINEGNYNSIDEGIKQYILECKEKEMTARYIGSLVADFHRNLIKGGVYIYPATTKSPNGKLRLLYEGNPLAFIAEQAGGKASTGTERIMELKPTELHQRCPLVIGSKNMVERVESLMKEYATTTVE